MTQHVIIIGAGPAGLTAGYLLTKEKIPVTVLEADPHYVGGIARTVSYKNYHFDIGGHRFFSKAQEVEDLWTEILPHDLLQRPRASRIFYRKKFFPYPLKAVEALYKLGIIESFLCVLSYLKARLFPIKNPKSFTDWVTNHFGHRLYSIFFKTYTEKVWGMRCEDISADWAAQRIKGLSLTAAIMNAVGFRRKKNAIKTLIDTFRYPRKGPGMLWEAGAEQIKQGGGKVILDSRVYTCKYENDRWQVNYCDGQDQCKMLTGSHLISSAPLREMVLNYLPQSLSAQTYTAAKALQYRDFLIVVLILKDRNQFTDNWIYIHDASVDVGRIQNFKSWSPEMVPDPTMCCYGMEYFCFDHDNLWASSDEDLIKKATRELLQLGLAKADDIVDGCVVRQQKAYPVYNQDYQQNIEIIRHELEDKFPSLYLVGRNGMHKYNNQDHAMMTAMVTVKNILAGERKLDVWCVNQDAEYIESGKAGATQLQDGLRLVPAKK